MADDYGNSYNDASVPSIAPGNSISGTIEIAGDVDAFRFSLVKGMTYTFRLGAGQTGVSLSQYGLYLKDSAGGSITSDGGSGAADPATIQFKATTTGAYYLYANASFSGQTGTYTVSSTAGIDDDFADTYNDAGGYGDPVGSLSPNSSVSGSIETIGDTDAFAISLVKGMTYTFTLGPGQTGTSLAQYGLYLRDNAGGSVTSDSGSGTTDPATIQFKATATGTYYLYANASFSSQTGTYKLASTAGIDDDYADTYNDAGGYGDPVGSLSPNSSASGSIETIGDTDAFKISLVKGMTYIFTLGPGQTGTSLAQYGLYLRDNAGGSVTGDSGSGATDPATIQFKATTTGAYYLYANASFSSQTGTYKLASTAGIDDDYADDWNDSGGTGDTPGTLSPSGSITGSIETIGDTDAFKINLVQGITYTFTLGPGQTGASLTQYGLYLRDSAGGSITSDSGSGTTDPATFQFTATATGAYYLYANASFSSQTGTYKLSASGGTGDDYADDWNDSAGTGDSVGGFAPNTSTTGKIETVGDVDAFKIMLTQGMTYTFTLGAGQTGTSLTQYGLYLKDGAGGSVTSDSGSGATDPATFQFTATTTGAYYLYANASFTNQIGTYTLSASGGSGDDYADDWNDSAGTGDLPGSLAPGGQAAGTVETQGDVDAFKITLTQGMTYTFSMAASPTGTPLPNFNLRLTNGAGTYLTGDTGANSSDPATFSFTATATGAYYLYAASSSGTSLGRYTVTASGGAVGPDDYRDRFADASSGEALGTLSPNGSKTGTLEVSSDSDVFQVELTQGTTYTFRMQGSPSGNGSLNTFSLALYDSNTAQSPTLGDSTAQSGQEATFSYTATRSGLFYLAAASATGADAGTYLVSASGGGTQPPSDDYRNTFNGTGNLGNVATTGMASSGRLEKAGDLDVFAVTLAAGTSYTFDLVGQANGSTALPDTALRLLNGNGTAMLANNNFNGANSRIVYTATATGTFYLEASSGAAGGTGGYSVTARANFDDYRNTFNGAGTLGSVATAGTAVSGVLEKAGDLDVFAVNVTAGTSYTFELVGSNNGSAALPDTALRLLNGNGTAMLANNNYNGTNSRIAYTATSNTTVYLEASSGAAGGTGGYSITARADFDDYRNTVSGVGTLGSVATTGAAVSGVLEKAGDLDVFAVNVTAGTSYTFDLASSNNGSAALADTALRLLNGNGTALLTNNNFNGTNSRIVYTATSNTTVYLEASSGVAGGVGGYSITARAGFDDYRNTFNGAGTLGNVATTGAALSGVLEKAGDLDVFAVSLQAGVSYTFDLVSSANGAAQLPDTALRLLNGNGTALLANNNYNGTNSHIVFTAAAAGTYYLEAASGAAGGAGGYSVTARADFDDYRNTFNGVGTLSSVATAGTAVSGVLEKAGDLDVFAVTLAAGTSYTFDLIGSNNGSAALPDTALRLLNGNGTAMLTNNNFNGTNSRIVYTATATGTFYLEAASGAAGGTGGYSVTARANFDDYRNTFNGAGTLGSVATAGTAVSGVLEKAGDLDVFAVNITAGTSYTFDLVSSSNGALALPDTALRLLDGAGGVLLTNNNFNGTNSRIIYTATANGTLYLEAGSGAVGGTGGYSITARANFDDLADTITDAASPLGQIAVGGSVMGAIETAGDSDVFRFNLQAGHTYKLAAAGGAGAGMLGDGDLHLFNSGGTLLAYNDDATATTLDPAIQFTASADGIYYLDVSGVKNAAGAYTLSIFDLA